MSQPGDCRASPNTPCALIYIHAHFLSRPQLEGKVFLIRGSRFDPTNSRRRGPETGDLRQETADCRPQNAECTLQTADRKRSDSEQPLSSTANLPSPRRKPGSSLSLTVPRLPCRQWLVVSSSGRARPLASGTPSSRAQVRPSGSVEPERNATFVANTPIRPTFEIIQRRPQNGVRIGLTLPSQLRPTCTPTDDAAFPQAVWFQPASSAPRASFPGSIHVHEHPRPSARMVIIC
jgi:hypothetical protein